MAASKLNDMFLRKLTPAGSRQTFSDLTERGLQARLSASGKISFAFHGRDAANKLHTITLGRYPDMSLKAAREEAARTRQDLKAGHDLNAKKRSRRMRDVTEVEPTLRQIVDEYRAVVAPRLASWRPDGPRSTRGNAQRCIEVVFADLLDRPIASISTTGLAEAMKNYVPQRADSDKSTSNGQVSRARAYLSPVFDWVAGRGRSSRQGAGRESMIPVADVRETYDPAVDDPSIMGERDRVLSEVELRCVLPLLKYPAPTMLAARLKPEEDFRPIALRFMLLTAARREEVATMLRRDVDTTAGVWIKPNVKSTRGSPRSQSLPLSDAALGLLTDLPHFEGAAPNEFVFPNASGGKLGNWPRLQHLLEKASGTSGWHRHDLRRTAASIMLALDLPVSTIDRILGHKNPLKRENVSAAAGTYMRLAHKLKGKTDQQAAALDALAYALRVIEETPQS